MNEKGEFVLKNLKLALAILGIVTFGALRAAAKDPLQVAPAFYKLQLENDRVRVLEATVKPGELIPFHSHPDYTVYVVEGGMARFFSAPNDTGVVVELKTGASQWSNAETHSAKNVGTTTLRILITELKEPKPAMKKDDKK